MRWEIERERQIIFTAPILRKPSTVRLRKGLPMSTATDSFGELTVPENVLEGIFFFFLSSSFVCFEIFFSLDLWFWNYFTYFLGIYKVSRLIFSYFFFYFCFNGGEEINMTHKEIWAEQWNSSSLNDHTTLRYHAKTNSRVLWSLYNDCCRLLSFMADLFTLIKLIGNKT